MVRKYEWPRAMEIITQIAAGLDFAHKNNIVHGNLRPSNVLFDADEKVKLADFGQPPHYDAPNKKNWYNPPEHKKSVRGDIYAMGVIMHQLVTHQNPQYDSRSHLYLGDMKVDLPDEIVAMMGKMLAVRVGNRYQSCEELLLVWEDFQRRRKEASRQPVVIPSEPEPSRKPFPLWAIFAVIGLLAAVIVTVLYLSSTFGF
jgi:serine/threonine-protein kinase